LAPVRAILTALGKATSRDLQTFLSVGLNNFFLFGAVVAYGALADAAPFFLFIVILLLFPLTSDPLARIPASRLQTWPLSGNQRLALRLISVALSPVVWLPLLVLAATRQFALALIFLILVLVVQSLRAAGGQLSKSRLNLSPLRYVPRFPGRLGGIIRNNVRQLLGVLDFYLTLILSAGMLAYRWIAHPAAGAFPPQAILLGLTLSTYTQCSFGQDAAPGLTRYHLMPLRGWQILLAKDATFLMVLFILVLPTNVDVGLTFGLAAVALGRYPSLVLRLPHRRWRFTGGDIRFSALQMVLGAGLAMAEYRYGPWFLVVAVGTYALSLYAGGSYWDRRMNASGSSSSTEN
jgi:hypothetical protein